MKFVIFLASFSREVQVARSITMELSPRIKQKALKELREDESRKFQALAQFRQWIDKHQSLRNSRQGEY